ATRRVCALRSHLKHRRRADDLRALLHCRDSGKAGIDAHLRRRRLAPAARYPTPPSRLAHPGPTGQPNAFTCLQAALRGPAGAMCSITSALLRGLVSGMVQGAECNPVGGLVLGAVTNAPLGRFTRITPAS